MFLAVIIVVFLGLLTFYFFSISTYSYWRSKNVPYMKPIPLFGNFKDVFLMRENIVEAVNRLYNHLPDAKFIGFYQGRRPSLLVKDPDLIKSIMTKDFEYFTDRVAVSTDVKREPLLRNLSNMSGDEWRTMRHILNPVFSSSKMKAMFPMIKECTEELMSTLEKKSEKLIQVQELMTSYMIDIIGCCAFGIQISSLKDPNSQFRYMARKIFTPGKYNMLKRLCRSYFPLLFKILNLRTFPNEIEEFFFVLMKDLVAKRDESVEKRIDFVQLLLDMRNDTNLDGDHSKHSLEISQSLITSQSFIFFMAGLETSSTTLSFCMYELAMNPSVQDELFTCIDKTLKGNRNFSYEDILNITYLDEVLLETERKHPAVPLTTRRCNKLYRMADTDLTLVEGDNVVIPIYAIHHDPLYYPEPNKFEPDRFAESKSHRNNSLFLTFGIGPRHCIADRFARLVMMTALTRIIQNFRLLPCDKTMAHIKYDTRSFFLKISGGIWLNTVVKLYMFFLESI